MGEISMAGSERVRSHGNGVRLGRSPGDFDDNR